MSDDELIQELNTPESTHRSDSAMIVIDKPIFELHPNINGVLSHNNNYSDSPIYLFIVNHHGHASIVVFAGDGRLYSIGLGTTGESRGMPMQNIPLHLSTKAVQYTGRVAQGPLNISTAISADQAVLWSGDFLIRPEHADQKYTFRIVDIGFFTKDHAARIQAYVNKVQKADVSFRPFSFYTLYLNATYSYLSNPRIVGMTKSYVNCVGFASDIFRERVICSNAVGISDPSLCRGTRGKLNEADAFALIRRFTESRLTEADIEFLK